MPSPCTTSSGMGTTGAATGVVLDDEPEPDPLRSESFALAEAELSVEDVPESDAAAAPSELPRSPAHKSPSPIVRRTMLLPRARCSRQPGTRLPDARARHWVHSCWIAEVSDADGRVWNPYVTGRRPRF